MSFIPKEPMKPHLPHSQEISFLQEPLNLELKPDSLVSMISKIWLIQNSFQEESMNIVKKLISLPKKKLRLLVTKLKKNFQMKTSLEITIILFLCKRNTKFTIINTELICTEKLNLTRKKKVKKKSQTVLNSQMMENKSSSTFLIPTETRPCITKNG